MCLNTMYDNSNPPLNTVQLMVSKFFMFHENTELFPSSESYDLSLGNNGTNDRITLVFFGVPVRNQLLWVEVLNKDL